MLWFWAFKELEELICVQFRFLCWLVSPGWTKLILTLSIQMAMSRTNLGYISNNYKRLYGRFSNCFIFRQFEFVENQEFIKGCFNVKLGLWVIKFINTISEDEHLIRRISALNSRMFFSIKLDSLTEPLFQNILLSCQTITGPYFNHPFWCGHPLRLWSKWKIFA